MIKAVENSVLTGIKSSLSKRFGIDKTNLTDSVKLKKETLSFIFDKIRKKSDFLSAISYLEVSSESGKALNIEFSDPWLSNESPRVVKDITNSEKDLFNLKRFKSDHKISIDQIENIGMSEKDLFLFLEKKMVENEMDLIEKHLLHGKNGTGKGINLIKGFLEKVKDQNPSNFKEKSPLNGKILIGNKIEIDNLGSISDRSGGKVELQCLSHGLDEGIEFRIEGSSKYGGPYLTKTNTRENKIIFESNFKADNLSSAKLVVDTHYKTLDAFVSDLKRIIPTRKRKNLKVFVHGDLLQERITYFLNKNEIPSELKGARNLELHIAGLPVVIPSQMPENTVFVASSDALALYVGKNSGKFAIEEDIENENFKFFRSWKMDAVVQDSDAIAIAKNVHII